MPPTSFEVIKGVADHALPSGSAQYDTILVKIPKELQAQSEILIFLTEQPMKGAYNCMGVETAAVLSYVHMY